MLALMTLLAAPVAAAEWTPTLKLDLAASYWDEGAKVAAMPGAQLRLWGDDDSLFFGDTFLRFEGVAAVTPSYARLGPRIVFSPIAIFELSAEYLGSAYFGTFSSIKGFDDPDVIYTADVLDAVERGPGIGGVGKAEATLQGKGGPMVIAAWASVQKWDIDPSEKVTGAYFWEPESELLIGFSDITWSVNGVLLYEHIFDEDKGSKLYAGAMFNRATGVDTGDTFTRLGPMANMSFSHKWSLLVLVQPYIEDRIYTDPLPPYIGLRLRWQPLAEG